MRAVLVAMLLVVTLGAAGCGGGSSPGGRTGAAPNDEASKSAKQVLVDAVKAAKAAPAVHMFGHTDSITDHATFDVTEVKGKGGTGSVTEDGSKVDVVLTGDPMGRQPNDGKFYIRAPAAIWAFFGPAAGIKHASSLGGKWVEFSARDYTTYYAALAPFGDRAALDSWLRLLTSHIGPLTKSAMTYKGQSVIALRGTGRTLYGPSKMWAVYVAATGKPYPVFVKEKGSYSVSLSFDNWGKSVPVSAPSDAIESSKRSG